MSTEKLNASNTTDLSAIDRAIANAKARKAGRVTAEAAGEGEAPAEGTASPTETGSKRPRLTDEEKAARQQTRDKERAEKKEAREAVRAAKKAEKDAAKQPAHMRKVMKAAEKLGSLGLKATLLFNEATANLSASELAALATHIQHFNRVKATERALDQTLEVGQQVTVIGGDPRYFGATGTVTKAQRIRCYVQVEGANKPIYLFISDVEKVIATPEEAEAAAG